MASESPVCTMGFDYRQVLNIEMNGGLNGKEIDEGNVSSVAYLSVQIRRPLPRMRRDGLRRLARRPCRAVYGEGREAPALGARRIREMLGLQNGIIPLQDNWITIFSWEEYCASHPADGHGAVSAEDARSMTESLQVAYWLCVGSLFFYDRLLDAPKGAIHEKRLPHYRSLISFNEFFKGAIRLHLWLLPCSQSHGKGGDRQ